MRMTALIVSAVAGLMVTAGAMAAPESKLGSYFGFEPLRTIVVDKGCGPMVVGDVNADKLPDIVVVNNAKSRIEVYQGRKDPKTLEEMMKDSTKANQLRPTAYYDRKDISISSRAGGVRLFDVDGDGKTDIVYTSSSPAEVVILQQQADGSFKTMARHRIKGLVAGQSLLRIADVMGDAGPELIVLADDRVCAYPLFKDGSLGEPRRLGSGGQIAGLLIEDYDGDGLRDIAAIIPEDPMPIRLFRQQQDPSTKEKRGLLNSELRFESPAVRDADNARFPDRAASGLGIIERASRRVVFYDFLTSPIDAAKATLGVTSERETNAEVHGFADGNSKDRSVLPFDLDGDGMLDLLATNSKTNTIDLYRQRTGVGPGDAEQFSAFKTPKVIAVAGPGQWDESKTATVFVLSEEEKAVGVSRYDAASKKLNFPTPVQIKTPGATPAAIGFVTLDGVGSLAVVVKNKRDHTLELHQPMNKTAPAAPAKEAAKEAPKDAPKEAAKDAKEPAKDAPKEAAKPAEPDGITTIVLTGVNRPPQSMIAADVDQDGKSDLLLFTPGEPMVMVRGTDKSEKGRPAQVLTSEQMPQFGLVQAAGPGNTALLDMDGDGKPELVIADKNFVRACKYDEKTGWKVVNQVTVSDPGTDLVGLAVLPGESGGAPMLVASDKGNNRLLFLDSSGVKRRVRLMGFSPSAIYAGAFAGDNQPGILCLSDDAYALVKLAGNKLKMESFAAYRSDAADRSEHQLSVGDVNGDGFLDAVVCDAKDQTMSILTFTKKRNVLLAMESKIFETRMFSGGDAREFEPRDVIVADATGDGKNDVVMLVHDRIMVYPQMTPESGKGVSKADK